MSKYEIVRMPTDADEVKEVLEEYLPFLDAMYTEHDEAVFGEVNFLLDHWLFLWDTGAGYFLTKRDDNGELVLVAMLTQFRDMWHGRSRLNIHRLAVADESMDSTEGITEVIDYLKSIASLLRFDLLFYISRDTMGNEVSELVWNAKQ